MESRSDETTGRLPPNIRARSDGAIATEWRPTECDALCIWCFCGDSQYPQLINNKKDTRPSRLGASLRSGPHHYLSAYAASLRSVAPGSISFFFTIPKAAPLRGLPWAIILSPRFAGLRIPLAYGSQTIRQLPIYRTQMTY